MHVSPLLFLFAAVVSGSAINGLIERDAEPITLATRQSPTPGCLHSESRLCWDGTYDISTNYYNAGPRTGRTVRYTLDIKNVTLAPDGISRQVLAINGQIPGPNIVAEWGDQLEITVRNSMEHNGTSIHWHGIRMLRNFLNDGVNGVTECPIAPGDEKVYTFFAEQYGTTWYHSHYSAQYGDGVWGTMQINGPATAEYDIDLGPVSLTDWFWRTAYQAAYAAERTGPPAPQNFLVNGINVNPLDTTQGQRAKLTFTPGKKHRVRFVNTSTDTFFRVSLDGHSMTVIQTDFVPIVPYTAQHIGIAIGQRYDVIIEANQANATYWLRTWPQPCSARNANTGTGTANAYVQYEGASDVLPTSTPVAFTASCNDEQTLVPYVPITLDPSGFPGNRTAMPVSAPFRVNTTGGNVFRWSIMGPTPMDVDFSNPAVKILQDNLNANMPLALNSIDVEGGGTNTAYWVIQNLAGVAHPLHWHLHDGFLVSQGAGTFNESTAVLKWDNPPRRDVVMLPASGYVLLAFKTDNPGIGILHCHIAWHVSEGLSLQFVERKSEIFEFTSLDSTWTDTCTKWDAWYTSDANPYGPKEDSGLRKA